MKQHLIKKSSKEYREVIEMKIRRKQIQVSILLKEIRILDAGIK